jgi:acetolactate synthase-1/2/3 large subunit
MKVADYIVDFLIGQQVTDTFGIPGGVILELLYAFDRRKGELTPHLAYHEQAAGFAACGYAQAGGRLGVAYATKGPGFTNFITAMADAYYDSLPVMFITAHSQSALPDGCRCVADQEMDTCSMVAKITKYAKRIDRLEEIQATLQEACSAATTGRKGPVLLDFAASLFKKELLAEPQTPVITPTHDLSALMEAIGIEISQAKRPILLIGDGITQSRTEDALQMFAEKVRIPVLSSRYTHHLLGGSDLYYGYVGSHGVRYANFILSKADLVVALGNRLNFPSQSESYGKIVRQAKFLRIDIDGAELTKHEAMPAGHEVDLKELMPLLAKTSLSFGNHKEWMDVCDTLRKELYNQDVDEATLTLSQLLSSIPQDYTLVCDVGNNEFWVSRACVYSRVVLHTLYSKSFGTLGNALGKAIGAYYATRKPVVAVVGDQGLQMNIQELQFIGQHKLPIYIVLLNNHSSGMIKDREEASGYDHYLHTTTESGYGTPNFADLVRAYRIGYIQGTNGLDFMRSTAPLFIEIPLSDSLPLTPSLPRGRDCQDLNPRLDETLYDILNKL